MATFLQFALLGLGAGGAYSIAGIGLTQVYRGSGVLNLAHGAVAFFSAVLFVWAYQRWHLGFALAALLAVAAGGMAGGLVEVAVMRPLRRAAVLVRIMATLGVLAILQQAVPLIFGTGFEQQEVSTFYPSGAFRLGHTLSLPYDRLIVVAVTLVLGLVLRLVMDRTSFGLATTAAAENPLVASTMGVDAGRTALLNWVIGSALAGLAGVLLVPIVGSLDPQPLVLVVIPALAAAMVGRFSSYALTIAGGIAIGIGQSLLTYYQATIFGQDLAGGWPDALPFLVIIGFLVVGGTPFPKRGEIVARLPRVGRARMHPVAGVVVTLTAAALMLAVSGYLAATIAATAGLAIVGLSLVVITGLAGQVSLAQLSVSGVAALIAARLSHGEGWPFLAVLAIAVAAGAVVGVVFALPALRTRGPTLAIATIGVGIAIEEVVLANGNLTMTDVSGGTPVRSPSIFGLQLNGAAYPQRYAALAVVLLGLAAVAVSNLRSSPTGRRLLAVRSSEPAAASAGISVERTKTAAFVVAAALAALGGVIIAFQQNYVTYDQFGLLPSLNLVIFTMIGGIGYVAGPILGALISPTGLVNYFFASHAIVQQWLITLGGAGLIVILIAHPSGQAELGELFRDRIRRRRDSGRPGKRDGKVGPPAAVRSPAVLRVRGLTVGYGPVVAVEHLDLTIEPGHIVGLIGPNGAGKTTAIDAVSGFVPARSGRVQLGGTDLTSARPHQRARAGMARTFQTVEPFDDLTVAENLAVTAERVHWWHWATDLFRRRPVALPAAVRSQAQKLGLGDLDADPGALSQGQRRLLGVMRAIASGPAVLLLDEPAAGLDRTQTAHLGQVLRQLASQNQLGMLLVEHDVRFVTAVCDRVVAIDFGRTIFDGAAAEAASAPAVKAAYLGEWNAADGQAGIASDEDRSAR